MVPGLNLKCGGQEWEYIYFIKMGINYLINYIRSPFSLQDFVLSFFVSSNPPTAHFGLKGDYHTVAPSHTLQKHL